MLSSEKINIRGQITIITCPASQYAWGSQGIGYGLMTFASYLPTWRDALPTPCL